MRLKEEFRKETVINRSRFIACVTPAFSEEEARAYIEKIRKEFPDASHVCTAYVTGENDMIQRSSDNHEPAGTAGVPMLEAIRKSGLSSTCACVVRYFGGIKLGAGGLIRAYSGSVTDALAEAKKLDKVPVDVWQITYPYDLSGKLEGWLRRNTENAEFDYSDQVTCLFETREDGIADTIRDLTRGAAEAELIEHTFREVEVQ